LADNENATMVHADITRPRLVLQDPETRRLLDFDKPVALLAITIGHYIPDEADPFGVFASYRDQLAPGSYLALTHFTLDQDTDDRDVVVEMMNRSQNKVFSRPRDQVLRLFGDFELVEPGLVMTSHWRPETGETDPDVNDGLWAGVARKP
jgi:hypothetical protein